MIGRDNLNDVEMVEDDLSFEGFNRSFTKRDVGQPRRSPIRRKDKMRPEEEVIKSKAKKHHRKIQHRLKYEQIDWLSQV